MTPADVINCARDEYNATGDTFFTDAQLYNWLTHACNEFAKHAWLIEVVTSSTTVSGTQAYAYPTGAIAIKRITVNGKKLKRITGRDDDAITLSNSTVTTQGWPIYYTDFNYQIYMRPIPDSSAYPISIYSYNLQTQIASGTDTILLPPIFHMELPDYLLARMFAKDKDITNMQLHMELFKAHVADAKAYKNRLKRSDSFATVQSEESLPVTILGEV